MLVWFLCFSRIEMWEFTCLIQVNSGFCVKSCNLVTTYLQRGKKYSKSLGSKLACLKNQFLLPYIARQYAWTKVTQRQSVCFCSSFYICFHTSLLCYHGSPWVQKALAWSVRQLVSLHARCLASFPLWNVSLLHLPLLIHISNVHRPTGTKNNRNMGKNVQLSFCCCCFPFQFLFTCARLA